jgi:hypothetical protein
LKIINEDIRKVKNPILLPDGIYKYKSFIDSLRVDTLPRVGGGNSKYGSRMLSDLKIGGRIETVFKYNILAKFNELRDCISKAHLYYDDYLLKLKRHDVIESSFNALVLYHSSLYPNGLMEYGNCASRCSEFSLVALNFESSLDRDNYLLRDIRISSKGMLSTAYKMLEHSTTISERFLSNAEGGVE